MHPDAVAALIRTAASLWMPAVVGLLTLATAGFNRLTGIASITAVTLASLHWFIPALNAPERAGMLGAMRQGLPAEAFAGVLGIAESTLAASQYARLQRDLALPPGA